MNYLKRAHALVFLSLMTTAIAEETISLQFLAIPRQVRPEPVEVVIGQNETIQVHTPGNELSQPYQVPKMDSIVLGKSSFNEDGVAKFDVYGRAKLLDNRKQIILLLRRGPTNEDGFTVLPISGEMNEFKGGSYFLLNASGTSISGQIGNKRFEIEPGSKALINPSATHEGGGAQATFAYKRGDEWKVFRDTRWSVNPAYRSMVFFFQNPSTSRLAVAPVVDMLPYDSE